MSCAGRSQKMYDEPRSPRRLARLVLAAAFATCPVFPAFAVDWDADGKAADFPRADWFKMVEGRKSAKANGSERRDRIEALVARGAMAACREHGEVRLEGKEYVVQDGDIINFRFAT